MGAPRNKPTSKGLRDLFFLVLGTALLYHEFWQRPDPSPLGVFVALFLFGLIPAFRADEGVTPGPLTMIAQLLVAMGSKTNGAKPPPPEATDPPKDSRTPAEGKPTSTAPESSEPGSS